MGKIAILAVHGIGKHLAGETQDAVADLLMSLPARGPYGNARQYSPFQSVDLQIPLQPVPTQPYIPPVPGFWKRIWNLYVEESDDFATATKLAGPRAPGAVAVDYTDRLLRQYKGGADGNIYKTNRLEGTRLQNGRKVDIYEVLWADLAKPDNSVVVFFLSLFQLIMHLGSLSRLAVDSGAAEGADWVWRLYRLVQRYAVRLLQIFVPLLEVVLLIAIASCLPRVLAGSGSVAAPLALGVLCGIVVGIVITHNTQREVTERPWLWALFALSPLVLGAGLPFLFFRSLSHDMSLSVRDAAGGILFWLSGGTVLLYWILSNYKDHRKGAVFAGILLFAVGFGFYIYFLFSAYNLIANRSSFVLLATLWTAEVLLGLTRLCWAGMIVCAIAASLLGSCAWRRMKKADPAGDGWGRARAAVRTSRLALALPAVLFMLVTLVIWAGVVKATNELGPDTDHAPIFTPLAYEKTPAWFSWAQEKTLLPPPELADRDPRYYRPAKTKGDPPTMDYALRVLAWSIGYQLPVVLGFVALTAFLMLWWVLPSVLTESPVPRGENRAPRDTSDDGAMRMGTWMSRGLDATVVFTALLWTAAFVVSPLYHLVNLKWYWIGDALGPITFSALNYPVVGFGLLAVLATRGRTVLSTILDVDTYLRTSPINATPRATIFERYISTLRYLQNYRDEQGKPYDKIVIFAHSLGASISGDLLLYLHANHVASPVPITLVTFGNPTRQLLNRFFPYLYDWVRAVPDNGKQPLPQPRVPSVPPFTIANTALPDPAKLGVGLWVNAYRSGDYVGRSLWLDEWYHRPAYPGSISATVLKSADRTRWETCIGAGAHTRYMDDTAPDMAFLLDSLL